DPHLIDGTLEAVLGPAATADAYRLALQRPRIVQVVEQDLPGPFLAIDEQLHALRITRTIVGKGHVMPLVQCDGLVALQADAFIQPLGNVVVLHLAFEQVQAVAGWFEHIRGLGDDGACSGGGIDPRGNRVLVVVVAEASEAGDVLALDETLAIEARGLADASFREARISVLGGQRAGGCLRRSATHRSCVAACACSATATARTTGPTGARRGARLRHGHWRREIPVERVISHEAIYRSPGFRRTGCDRLLPFGLCRSQLRLHAGEGRARGNQFAIQPLQLRLLLARGCLDERWRVALASRLAVFRKIVEVRVELIELLVRQWVVLVAVAPCAACRQAE